jgi:CheY-like chemotaxis protein
MRFLVVEDDSQMFDRIRSAVEALPGRPHDVTRVATEYDFTESIGRLDFDAAIIDIMLPWAKVSKEIPPPPENVKREGTLTAGRRCRDLMLNTPSLSSKPYVFLTNLDSVIDGPVVQKSSDLSPLVSKLKEIMRLP